MEKKTKGLPLLCLFTALGLFLRCEGIDRPLWVDEALFASWVGEVPHQEFLPVALAGLFGVHPEWVLRLPFVLSGTLTIPALWYILKDKAHAWTVVLFIAIFPLFVFWSGLARPYAMAGLFSVLSWRWRYFQVLAVLCTPLALIASPPLSLRDWRALIPVGLSIFIALVSFSLRGDTGRDFLDATFLHNASRLHYLPALALCLWVGRYALPVRLSAGDRKVV